MLLRDSCGFEDVKNAEGSYSGYFYDFFILH